jgi:hypothetical protein
LFWGCQETDLVFIVIGELHFPLTLDIWLHTSWRRLNAELLFSYLEVDWPPASRKHQQHLALPAGNKTSKIQGQQYKNVDSLAVHATSEEKDSTTVAS